MPEKRSDPKDMHPLCLKNGVKKRNQIHVYLVERALNVDNSRHAQTCIQVMRVGKLKLERTHHAGRQKCCHISMIRGAECVRESAVHCPSTKLHKSIDSNASVVGPIARIAARTWGLAKGLPPCAC
jgi:hypothetical protein